MNVTSTRPIVPTSVAFDVHDDVADAARLGPLETRAGVTFDVRQGRRNLWLVASIDGRERVALRIGHGGDDIAVPAGRTDTPDGIVFEFASALGALRAKIAFPADGSALVRCTTSLLPAHDLALPFWPRDLYVLGATGRNLHTAQRGLRSGIVFASTDQPAPCTLFYFQNFSSLTEYFEATKRSPSDTVGGRWPELGYAPPAGDDCVLPKSRELVVSDAFLTITNSVPKNDGETAAAYLDLLAETYLCLPRPAVAYHDWPARAAQALRDVSISPKCTYIRRGTRYAMPYTGDDTKPPESMVQLTLAVNAGEYSRMHGGADALATALAATASTFFDEEVGSVVRWLPGEEFEPAQAEEHMNHDDMDSWYLHHALFNLSRLAGGGDERARTLFERSLPFAIRVARRFNYRWPIFFNLRTLDIVRAESAPGRGGECDVGGLYALVMLHANELFGDPEFLAEAERGVMHLRDLGLCARLSDEHDRLRSRSGHAAVEENPEPDVPRAERDLHGEPFRQHVAVAMRLRARAPLPNVLRALPAARRAVPRRVRRARGPGEIS